MRRVLLDTNVILDVLLEREPFVGAVNDEILRSALALSVADYEDAVQVACALATDLEVIVTRDPAGFASSPVPSIALSDFVQNWGLRQAAPDLN